MTSRSRAAPARMKASDRAWPSARRISLNARASASVTSTIVAGRNGAVCLSSMNRNLFGKPLTGSRAIPDPSPIAAPTSPGADTDGLGLTPG